LAGQARSATVTALHVPGAKQFHKRLHIVQTIQTDWLARLRLDGLAITQWPQDG